MDFLAASANSPGSNGTTTSTNPSDLYGSRILLVAWVFNNGTLITSVAGKGATWTRVASKLGTGVGVELWLGYGPTTTGNITASHTSQRITLAALTYSAHGPLSGVPTVTAVSASGNSVTVDPGTVTPALTDLVCCAGVWANVTTASARTDTPVAPEGHYNPSGAITASATMRGEYGVRQPNVTTACKRTWTVTSAQWAALNVAVALPRVSSNGKLYKGRLTAALDAAEAA